MKTGKCQILLLLLLIIQSCDNPKKDDEILQENISQFKVTQDYSDFSNKMENGDTLSMIVNLSICMWEEYDIIKFSKRNENTYLQINKIVGITDDTIKFPKKNIDPKIEKD